jgi:RimJ/RimL family protein N-acetyltransferase
MNLESQRLVLRGFVHEDWKDLYEYLSDEHVVKYEPYGTLSADNCKKEAERRSEDESFRAVCLKEGKLIGNVYFQLQPPAEFLTWEIGFVFNRHYHGRVMRPKPAGGFFGTRLRNWARIGLSATAIRKTPLRGN